ncbi:MAG: peroxiredoxin [Candidatus Thermoplasmatota archaeon]|nr:peroxiredoxin [Candidatus Thermoplasmatota archaeon]MCL5789093.1 peroxiredoxin [Candidatus Thermoplasmatota archaeon]
MMNIGDKVPDFELVDTDLKPVKSSSMLGHPTVLAFFPGAFTSVCTKEMCTFRDAMASFNRIKAQVYGISVDQPFSLAQFKKENNLNFPLLSDFTESVSRAFGGVHENAFNVKGLNVSKRAVFALDKNGKVAYRWVSENPGKEPDYKEIEEAVAKLG